MKAIVFDEIVSCYDRPRSTSWDFSLHVATLGVVTKATN